MTTTAFVEMYHPDIPSTITSPARVAAQAVDERYAKGWLLVDPEAPQPVVETPYYTKETSDSRFLTEAAARAAYGTDVGDPQRAELDAFYARAGDLRAFGIHMPHNYGTVDPTGVADSSAAFIGCRDAVNAAAVAVSGTKRGRARTHVPPGRYRLVSPEALISSTPTPANLVSGLVITGAGRELTELVFDPATGGQALAYVDDNVRQVLIGDMTITGLSSSGYFFRSTGNGTASGGGAPQNVVFERVNVGGVWGSQFRLDGGADANNNSEWSWFHCNLGGTVTTAVFHCGATAAQQNQDQFLNYNFFGCNVEPASGDCVRLDYGGCVNVYGGSWIITGAAGPGGRFFYMPNGTHFGGVCHLGVDGTRFEIRNSSVKLIDCHWKTGNVRFSNISTDGYIAGMTANQITAYFYAENDGGPIVTWEACSLAGAHEYARSNETFFAIARAAYRDCIINQHTSAASFIKHTVASGPGNSVGGAWPVEFENCKGNAPYSAGTSTVAGGGRIPFDTVVGWNTGVGARPKARAFSMKTDGGHLPNNHLTPSVIVGQLPTHAVITGVRFYSPAVGGGSTATNWLYVLTNGAGTEIARVEGGGVTAWNAGWSDDTGRIFIPCDTDTKATLILTATNVLGATTGAFCIIEYLA